MTYDLIKLCLCVLAHFSDKQRECIAHFCLPSAEIDSHCHLQNIRVRKVQVPLCAVYIYIYIWHITAYMYNMNTIQREGGAIEPGFITSVCWFLCLFVVSATRGFSKRVTWSIWGWRFSGMSRPKGRSKFKNHRNHHFLLSAILCQLQRNTFRLYLVGGFFFLY